MKGREDEDAQKNCGEPYIDQLNFFQFIHDMII